MAKNDFDCTTLTPEQRDARLALDVERLLRFGRKHKLIKELDELVFVYECPQRDQTAEGGPGDPRRPAGRNGGTGCPQGAV